MSNHLSAPLSPTDISNGSSTDSLPYDYTFPVDRLKTTALNPSKIPLVLVACGSFSPITYLHLRMFEMALDWVNDNNTFELIGGYFSPVSDDYKKQDLAHYSIANILS